MIDIHKHVSFTIVYNVKYRLLFYLVTIPSAHTLSFQHEVRHC